ncbi:hypothetical protein N7457_000331 [Penicillium paradoxum]|uniref:uncharacterized protein n=1 Tax=Penicillium paradoxum TaxID=176176 RepID=UPI002546C6A5|nr:uncharacterized protein N7457_000331 [Penicillium paradoxum]KAJ5793732.1 hypothetical protein N7457_000331 [Penicillium paradoxum]
MKLYPRPSLFILAVILAVTQSGTSQPIRTSKWVKIAQFPDPNSHGTWKVFEKESFDKLPDPPHVTYSQNSAWQSNQNNESTEEVPSYHYATGTSESGKPTVSVLIPPSSETIPESKPYDQHIKNEHDHYSLSQKERSINAINAIAAQRQSHYSKLLKSLHAKHASNNMDQHTTPSSSSSSPYSRHLTSFFAYRFSLPVEGSDIEAFSENQIPGIFATVTILLMVVWISIFIIGLVELGNYLWKRMGSTSDAEATQDGNDEEGSMVLDETTKMPLRGIALVPSEESRAQSVTEHGYTFLDLAPSDSDSDSVSESDEEDYRIF